MDRDGIIARAREYIENEHDETFSQEVQELLYGEKWDELADRFYTDLEFGTGGLRGVIGGGYNRMNTYVVQRSTQGLATYVLEQGKKGDNGRPSAVIAYDSRRYSSHFALQAALVFAANGIKAYLFSSLRPTPELSFSVRELGASTGIVITASHNPPQYNGYKVYWDDGAQIVAPHDKAIIEKVSQVGSTIERMDEEEAKQTGLLQLIDEDIDAKYVAMVKETSVRPKLIEEQGGNLEVVYTPLHGTGAYLLERALGDLGIEVTTVPEQREPNGEFPTVELPNPEEGEALRMAIDLGKETDADIVMGSDPDADRIGIAVPTGDDFTLVTGNQLGTLLADYVLSSRKELGTLPDRPAFVKTIVTTELQRKVAAHYGAEVYDTLTGFKHIAALIRKFEETADGPTYVLGGEESYGYLLNPQVRDKDAISAAVLTAEMALYHVSNGKSVLDRLNEIYRQFGYYEEIQISKYFRGQEGKSIMQNLMDSLRENHPREIADVPVVKVCDYLERTTTYYPSAGTESDIDLPVSNVLQFILEDETVVSARPSGTEPKIKFYASVTRPGEDLEQSKKEVADRLDKISDFIERTIASAEGN
jgi:phosphoglucomutase